MARRAMVLGWVIVTGVFRLSGGEAGSTFELNRLGVEYLEKGQYREAERKLLKALAGAGDSQHRAEVQSNLAALYMETGELAKAFRNGREAYEATRRAGVAPAGTMQALNNLASIYYSRRDFSQAESLFRMLAEAASHMSDRGEPEIAFVWNNLALVLIESGRYAEAQPWLTRAQNVWETHYGSGHFYTARGLLSLGVMYRHGGDFPTSWAMLHRSLTILERDLGADHALIATVLQEQALVLKALKRNVEAKAAARRSEVILKSVHKENLLGYQVDFHSLRRSRRLAHGRKSVQRERSPVARPSH